MEDEKIVREEAKEFFSLETKGIWDNAIGEFHKIKNRLQDFYAPEVKTIFLDEIILRVKFDLEEHIEDVHQGTPADNCQYEGNAKKLLFYLKQELDTLPAIVHKNDIENPKFSRSQVFVSYSHEDKKYLDDIKRHFKPFNDSIDFWDDTKILAGQKWLDEINKAINITKVAILLVSTDFLGSRFVMKNELPPLLAAAEKDGASILILILRPCLFEEFSNLNEYQALNPPSRPVSIMSENEREELYVNMVRQVKSLLI